MEEFWINLLNRLMLTYEASGDCPNSIIVIIKHNLIL